MEKIKKFEILKMFLFLIFLLKVCANGNTQIAALDSSFGTGGIVSTDYGPYQSDINRDIAIQPDGKIVVVGHNYLNEMVVVRYNSDGSLDNSFDFDGIKLLTPGGIGAIANSVTLQSNGKILITGAAIETAGSASLWRLLIVRLNNDGSMDNSFDSDGFVINPIGYTFYSYSVGRSIDVFEDTNNKSGKIVVTGYTCNSDLSETLDTCFVACFNNDGSLDASFSGDGVDLPNIGPGISSSNGVSVLVQNDEKILVAIASWQNASSSDYALVRYNVDGSMDNFFGIMGVVNISPSINEDEPRNIALQNDGKILLIGSARFNPTFTNLVVYRLNQDGSLDNAFDTDGMVVTGNDTLQESGCDVAIFTNGQIGVTGWIHSNITGGNALVRKFNADGSHDTSFDLDGMVSTEFGSIQDEAVALSIQQDQKIVICGRNPGSLDNIGARVARYNENSLSTGIYETNSNEFNLYPNPTQGPITLKFNHPVNKSTITIINSGGQKLFEQNNFCGNTLTIDMNEFTRGTYQLLVYDGNSSYCKSIIKQY